MLDNLILSHKSALVKITEIRICIIKKNGQGRKEIKLVKPQSGCIGPKTVTWKTKSKHVYVLTTRLGFFLPFAISRAEMNAWSSLGPHDWQQSYSYFYFEDSSPVWQGESQVVRWTTNTILSLSATIKCVKSSRRIDCWMCKPWKYLYKVINHGTTCIASYSMVGPSILHWCLLVTSRGQSNP